MVLEEKQRKGEAALIAFEAECSGFDQDLRTKRHHLEQSQGQKQQLVDDLENAEQEGKRLKQELELMEKAPISRRTPQQVLDYEIFVQDNAFLAPWTSCYVI